MAESLIVRRGGLGGEEEQGEFEVRFIDIDGTVLKTQYVDAGQNATPPDNPNRTADGLTFQGWLSGDSATNIQRDSDIGAIYNTTDGKTHIYLRYDNNPRRFILNIYKNDTSTLTVDWGNGTSWTTSASGDIATPYSPSYNGYATPTIKIWISSGSGRYSLGTYSGFSPFMFFDGFGGHDYVRKILLGNNVKHIGYSSFRAMRQLSLLSISNSVEFIGGQSFYETGLRGINIPNSVTTWTGSNPSNAEVAGSLDNYAPIQYNYNLKNIVFSKNCKLLPSTIAGNNRTFNYFAHFNYSLEKIVFPATETNYMDGSNVNNTNYTFNYCYNLRKIVNFPFYANPQPFVPQFFARDCHNLEIPKFPDNLVVIRNSAFLNQNTAYVAGSGIDIPASVQTIQSNAFTYVIPKYVILRRTVQPTSLQDSSVFSTNGNYYIYVPDDKVDIYKSWTNYGSISRKIKPLSQFSTYEE